MATCFHNQKKQKINPGNHMPSRQPTTEIAALKGIKPGDQVVNSGQLKLQNGTQYHHRQ